MASSLILKRFLAPNILTRSVVALRPKVASGTISSRSINTDGFVHHVHKDVRLVEIDCHRSIFRDVSNAFRTALYCFLDFHPNSHISQMRNLLNSIDVPRERHFWTGRWNVMQSAQAIHLSRDTSEDEYLNVYVERDTVDGGVRDKYHNVIHLRRNYFGQLRMYRVLVNTPTTLVIERKGRKGCEDEGDVGRYIWSLATGVDLFITSAIKIEHNNQTLKVTLPKVKVKWISCSYRI